jgi:hypothetical protein
MLVRSRSLVSSDSLGGHKSHHHDRLKAAKNNGHNDTNNDGDGDGDDDARACGAVNPTSPPLGPDHAVDVGMVGEALALALHIIRTEGVAGMYVGLEAQLWQAAAKEAILNTVRRGLGST